MNFELLVYLIAGVATLALPGLAVAFIFRKQLYKFVLHQVYYVLYYLCEHWIELLNLPGLAAVIIGALLVTGAETNEARFWGFASIWIAVACFGLSYAGYRWRKS